AGHLLVREPGLGELDQGPVGVLRVDKRFLPIRPVGRDVEQRDTPFAKVRDRTLDVGDLQRDMVNALASTVQETSDEPVRTTRCYKLDLPSAGETELRPSETLVVSLAGEQKCRA